MIAYPDTSFLYGFYLKQSNSPAAAACAATMKEPLHLTELLRFEFRQSLRFQVWRHLANPREGVTRSHADAAMSQLESDFESGVAVLVPCDLIAVVRRAEALSQSHTTAAGTRGFDLLHVATALYLGASDFLSFDELQRRLAKAEGLRTRP